ncbi:26S proteasome regulatory subunit RPN10 [Cyanidioschyzon merolae strain 10D]|jgi:26S proteasome regulatory subunit N10|uniref:26S proteasome regulatory subunit RPN10 n=1 Tax=Cyanidioschyzon merolae (strain NIES-3377 / 10D) TaxID=280699 RepID=M1VJP9_CYAM1|nr:26S proteasome regulatory subunit RPN10 [Cyanidioschyzon merolae strain 10D]BAM81583.1 26S proteasome regulatory subunit RPN10 [Cyanidioschyzon merolae strain 10D]|eukprot:XP_005537619.1 26S proteasome regulatory subunit RPN10 [Cyanidioschyzon merolae strain 10D]
MVLEATMICIDNSEWMRNGDVAPSRMDAQLDAVNLLCNVKLDENPENTVGLLTLAGLPGGGALWTANHSASAAAEGRPRWLGTGAVCRVLITQTRDPGRVLSAMHQVIVEGEVDFIGGLQKAQLALKHRQNRNQRQRIICFIASPVAATAEELVQLGRNLKKNNVAVDVVLFGSEWSENEEKMKGFIQSVNVDDNSHLITVPPGTALLAEALMTTPLMQSEQALMAGAAGSDARLSGTGIGAFSGGAADIGGFGFDPSADPELALALQMSLEEERNRQAAAAAGAGSGADAVENNAPGSSSMTMEVVNDRSQAAAVDSRTSLQSRSEAGSIGHRPDSSAAATADSEVAESSDLGNANSDIVNDEDEQMDEELRLAIELSKQEASTGGRQPRSSSGQALAPEDQSPDDSKKKSEPRGST